MDDAWDDTEADAEETLTNNGTITWLEVGGDGVATNNGTVSSLKTHTGASITNNAGATITYADIEYSDLDNYGTIETMELTALDSAIITNESTGKITTLKTDYGTVENIGEITTYNLTGTVLSNGALKTTTSSNANASIGTLTVDLGVVSNYATINSVALNSGYMVNYDDAKLGIITIGTSTESYSSDDTVNDLNAVFVNYGKMENSSSTVLTMNSGTAYNFGDIDNITISEGHFFNSASDYQISIKYDEDGHAVYEDGDQKTDENGYLAYEDSDGTLYYQDSAGNYYDENGTSASIADSTTLTAVYEQILQYETTDVDTTYKASLGTVNMSGGVLFNYDGATIEKVTISDGTIYNLYDDDEDLGIVNYDTPIIKEIDMSGGELQNLTNAEVTKLSMTDGKTYSYGTLRDVNVSGGYFMTNGYVVDLVATGGEIQFDGGVTLSFTATDSSDNSDSFTSITNNSGSFILSAELSNVTVDNWGTFGVLGNDQYDADDLEGLTINTPISQISDYSNHIYSELILNSGTTFNNNKKEVTNEDGTTSTQEGALMNVAIYTGATINNYGSIGSYLCEHGDLNYGTLTIYGGTVNNTDTGYIYNVNMSDGSLTSSGSSAQVYQLNITGGTVTNSGGSMMYDVFMNADGQTLTNVGNDSYICFLDVVDGTVINGTTSGVATSTTSDSTDAKHDAEIEWAVISDDAVLKNYAYIFDLQVNANATSDAEDENATKGATGGTAYNYAGAEIIDLDVGDDGVFYNYENAKAGSDDTLYKWVEVSTQDEFDAFEGQKISEVTTNGTKYYIYQITEVDGNVTVHSGGSVYNYGELGNTLYVSPQGSEGGATVINYSTGSIDIAEVGHEGILYNAGSITQVTVYFTTYSNTVPDWAETSSAVFNNIAGGTLTTLNVYAGTANNYSQVDNAITTATVTGGTLNNYGEVVTLTQNGGEVYNIGSGNYSYTVSDTSLSASGAANASIGTLNLNYGYTENGAGATINQANVLNYGTLNNYGEITDLKQSSGTVDNYNLITTATITSGTLNNESGGTIGASEDTTSLTMSGTSKVENEGTIYNISYSKGTLKNNYNGIIYTLNATGTTAASSSTTASITNSWGAYIQDLSLTNVVLTNSGVIGYATDSTGTVSLNSGSIFNNQGTLLSATVYENASLNNEGTIGSYNDIAYVLDISGGTVNNSSTGWIVEVALHSGSLYNTGITGSKTSSIGDVTIDGDATAYNAAEIYGTVTMSNGTLYSYGSNATIKTLNISGGTAYNGYTDATTQETDSSASIDYVTVNKDGVFHNNGITNQATVGSWDDGSKGGTLTNTGLITTLEVLADGQATNDGTIVDVTSVVGTDALFTNNEGAEVTGTVKLEWSGTVANAGTINTLNIVGANWATTTATNTGTIAILDSIYGTTTNSGTIGTITKAEEGAESTLSTLTGGATLYGSTLTNSGTISTVTLSSKNEVNTDGAITSTTNSSLTNESGGTIYEVDVDSGSTFTNNSGGTVEYTTDIAGTANNYGTLNGTTYVYEGGTLTNYSAASIETAYVGGYGTAVWGGTLSNFGHIDTAYVKAGSANLTNEQSGTIGNVTAEWSGTFNNYGEVTGTVTVVGSGAIVNNYAGDGAKVSTVIVSGGSYNQYGKPTLSQTDNALALSVTDFENLTYNDTLESLTLNSGSYNVMDGSITIESITVDTAENDTETDSTLSVASGAIVRLYDADNTERSYEVDTLDNSGDVLSKGDLTVNSNVTGTGNLTVEGTLKINNTASTTVTDAEGNATTVAGKAANITAEVLIMNSGTLELSDVLTLTKSSESNYASNLTASKLDMQESSTLTVEGNFQASSVVINADGVSGSLATQTIISTDTLTIADSTTMTFVVTEAALLQLGLTTAASYDDVYTDGSTSWMTLLSIEDTYTGSVSDFILQIVNENGEVIDSIASTEYYAIGYDGYHFDVVSSESGVITDVNIYLAQVPEPSTSALSLVALTALLARRRRRREA